MEPEYIELTTKLGKLKGLVKKSAGLTDKTYYSFQGIPYAKPPLGELRFKAPVAYGSWDNVRDATKEGNDFIQKHMLFRVPIGDEDSLYLNVYSPQVAEGAARPVMFWIHGGGFARGSGSTELYGPDFLVERDVVLVTVNYRCGALGFLSLESAAAPGNIGLKDQVLALCWVRDNISCYGGDPDNITLFGESAGAASVHYHLLSPLSRGLFHKAVLQSGSSLCQWAYQPEPRRVALELARLLGCEATDDAELLQFLTSVPARQLIDAQDSDSYRQNKEILHKLSLLFLPCVDAASDTPFLPDYPRKLMEKGEFAKVPVIIGINDKEGLLALSHKSKLMDQDLLSNNLSAMVPTDLAIANGTEEEKALGKEILQFYTNQDNLSWDSMHGFIDFMSDVAFSLASEKTTEYLLQNSSAPVFRYLLTYTSPRAYSSFLLPMTYPEQGPQFVGTGASHGDELIHLFKPNIPQAPYVPPTPEDEVFMSKLINAWVTFAYKGDPNCEELGVAWKADDVNDPSYLELGKDCKNVEGTYFPKRLSFWKTLYEKYSYVY